jgi:hypothetical protein
MTASPGLGDVVRALGGVPGAEQARLLATVDGKGEGSRRLYSKLVALRPATTAYPLSATSTCESIGVRWSPSSVRTA